MARREGQVVTFYSYKGGVGRSMALANTAAMLARWGYKTLIVDWDLEAPGLENFYRGYSSLRSVSDEKGVVDIISAAYPGMTQQPAAARAREDTGAASPRATGEAAPAAQESAPAVQESAPASKASAQGPAVALPPWRDYVVSIKIKFKDDAEGTLHLLTAGRRSGPDYFQKVRLFDVQDFYREQRGGYYIERLRREWKSEYDVVLIDSRTGVTDIGGICTIQLPDILVLIFTTTEHGLVGAADVARKATRARQSLPFDRLKLLTLPVLSRFDDTVEFNISQQWLDRVEREVKDLYDDWLPADVRRRDMIELTKIPYKAFFSYGELLPVVEEGTVNRAGMAFAYETLAALLANRLEGADQLRKNRDGFVQRAALDDKPLPSVPAFNREELAAKLAAHERWLAGRGERADGGGPPVSFKNAQLRAADFAGANLSALDFGKADLGAASLAGAVLAGADFTGANMQGADLRGAVAAPSVVFENANLLDANLQGAALSGARLKEANLQGARLVSADLRRADLEGVSFARADLKDARLRDAVLRKATLTDAANLTPEQLGGTDLSDARLPEEAFRFDRLSEVATLRKLSHGLLVAVVALCAFVFAAVLRTTDAQLVSNTASLRLPLLSFVEVTPPGFYLFAPILLFLFYIWLLGVLSRLWVVLSDLPAVFPDGRTLDEKVGPLLGAILRANFKVLRERGATGGRFLAFLFVFLAWAAAPLTLLYLWARYLTRHDWEVTWLHVIMLISVVYMSRLSYGLASARLRGDDQVRAVFRDDSMAQRILFIGGWAVILFALSVGAIHGVPARDAAAGNALQRVIPRLVGFFGYSPFANLSKADVSTRPEPAADGQPERPEIYFSRIKEADLAGRDLRYASARQVFMPKSDLTGADLTGADLAGADLRNVRLDRANLTRASLRGANLEYSSFNDANLTGADLTGAELGNVSLNRADLSHASLRGANLENSFFYGANLMGADLWDANLTGAVALTDAQLGSAVNNVVEREISGLVAKFKSGLTGERRDARDRLIQMHFANREAVVNALFAAADDEPESYSVMLDVVTVLAGVGTWEGTPEQEQKIKELVNSPNYRAPSFKAAVDRAIKNYRPRAAFN